MNKVFVLSFLNYKWLEEEIQYKTNHRNINRTGGEQTHESETMSIGECCSSLK
jgi:hypothetical protein